MRVSAIDLAVAADLARRRVDRQVEVAEDVGRRRGSLEATQDSADTGDQLARLERLDDIVVGAELEARDPVDDVVAGGEHDHGHGGTGCTQHPQHVET